MDDRAPHQPLGWLVPGCQTRWGSGWWPAPWQSQVKQVANNTMGPRHRGAQDGKQDGLQKVHDYLNDAFADGCEGKGQDGDQDGWVPLAIWRAARPNAWETGWGTGW